MLKAFGNDEKGAAAIEYALLALIIAVAVIAGASQLSDSVAALLTSAGELLTDEAN